MFSVWVFACVYVLSCLCCHGCWAFVLVVAGLTHLLSLSLLPMSIRMDTYLFSLFLFLMIGVGL